MITFNELNEQNHSILALSNTLGKLIDDRLALDNSIVAELFFRYFKQVDKHLADVQPQYANLLTHNDSTVRNTARQFISGASEINRILQEFNHRWVRKQHLLVDDHDEFIADTKAIFKLVRKRTQNEAERLYPLLRDLL